MPTIPIPLRHVLLAALAVLFTWPAWHPQFDISVDGSCAWLYNHLWVHDRARLAHLIFPHGPLDFLQTPLPVGDNLGWALGWNAALRGLFVVTGLRWAQARSTRVYWAYFAVLVLLLKLNMMDVLVFATVVHCIILAFFAQNNHQSGWLAAAIGLSAVGFWTKTIIGLPCFMLVGASLLQQFAARGQWRALLAWSLSVPAVLVAGWLVFFGQLDGFVTMLAGTFWLTVGNSAAVCHYPANNWWALGLAVAGWFAWPWFSADRRLWWLLVLPVFAFWKYGFSREDIWHLDTTFRVLLVSVAALAFFEPTAISGRKMAILAAIVLGFWANLRNAEGWQPYQWPGTGWKNGLDWLLHFSEKCDHFYRAGMERLQPHVLPDSVRHIIGAGTVDAFPWHYSWVAANQLRVAPRHVIQSYAAYHPWLDQLDADFFSGPNAPDFVIFHLKPYDEGGQFRGLDDRYLLQDAPKTLEQMMDRYRIRVRHARFLLLEKTTAHHWRGAWQTLPLREGWPAQIPQKPVAVRIKGEFHKTALGRVQSLLYKDAPIFADVHTGGVTRRIKLVPALFREGVWLAPWLELPNGREPYRLPDALDWLMPAGWTADTAAFELEWREIDPASGWIPEFRPEMARATNWNLLPEAAEVAPEGFSPGWSKTYGVGDTIPAELEIQAGIRAAHNSGCSQLVVSVSDATGKTVHYASTEYCPMGVGEQVYWPVSLRTVLPPKIAQPAQIKAYVWNTCKKGILVKGLNGREIYR